ncbi:DNA mismatch repair protein MutT [Brevibacterium sp. HMSC08F02]|uniref:NUDIX hydrolase n=1 Tax=Brevibacterium ravenspurgense TaxID=479117 RepID=A0A150H5S3_9MICO|nr:MULTISPECIES: NUDIX hydrolase [Brevibacterium]KXZ57411.1 putative mutator protein MutT4 [Brevibacterium ravenspurgense]MCG7300647.1 NUDIX hydrolase [Brevibacterium ravenspurgense]OFT25797.1 DNA mismatch repair protein MutT [Brevibacterium sp. HMSC08F02]OFT91027.1 DNA mismatch repair protein MutT [Brevibacterium sp. HMSC24B04]OFT96212.1 DNA mismatch repair protein MutT [Brevibacterium sp. HMSC22B09]
MIRPLPKPGPFPVRSQAVEETSAGGLVVDFSSPGREVAVIARINRAGRLEWCLPKGHLEAGETPAQAARREVAEETGIEGKVIAPLGSVDYWFSAAGFRIHKVVHHFLLRAVGGELTVENDPDHEAVAAEWVPYADLGERLSFANERRIALAASRLLRYPS